MDLLLEFLTAATVSASLTGLLLWLTKSWITERLKGAIKAEYDQKLETHRAELRSETEIQIERFRAQLSLEATEHRVRFSKLHEERARIISETYALLKEMEAAVNHYTNPMKLPLQDPVEKKRLAVANAYKNLSEYFARNSIFIPQQTAQLIETVNNDLLTLFFEVHIGVELKEVENKDDNLAAILEGPLRGNIASSLSQLESEFRKLLGDES